MNNHQPTPSPSGPIPLLQATHLAALEWLRHGFTTRVGGISQVYGRSGDLNLGLTEEDDPVAVRENRRRALAAVVGDAAGSAWTLIQTRQVHSATVLTLPHEAPRPLVPADGLITDVPGSMLAVLAADCVPILLADQRLRVVGAVHAGWRGTVARIVQSAAKRMQRDFGSRPEDLLAAIGPSIGPCCYQVGEEVHARFHEAFPHAAQLFAADRLNLWEANRRQLQEAGLPPAGITVLAACTACTFSDGDSRFFSHRAQQGRTGRMMGLIGVVPGNGTAGQTILGPVA